MLHIVCCTQEGIGLSASCEPVHLELSDKQQHLTSALSMMDVSLPSGRVRRCGTLTLPVEQVLIDGVIVIHGGGRVVLIRFVQRHEEHVQMFLRQPLDALTHRGRFQKIQCYQQLVPGIGAVEIQRAVKAQVHRLVNEIDLLIPIAEQVQKLTQQHGTIRKGIQVVQHLIRCPTLCRLAPNSYVEHLEHALFQLA